MELPTGTVPCGTLQASGFHTAAVKISFSLEAAPRDLIPVPVSLLDASLSEAQVKGIALSLGGFGRGTVNFLMAP